ncbi:MAG: hypothetical protein FWG02_01830 [Holophagaceae bacterium]|nr:hypothetical protein [Holophagaceae bacterium]
MKVNTAKKQIAGVLLANRRKAGRKSLVYPSGAKDAESWRVQTYNMVLKLPLQVNDNIIN